MRLLIKKPSINHTSGYPDESTAKKERVLFPEESLGPFLPFWFSVQ